MEQEHHITFGPFHLETTPARLWRGAQILPLRPRTLAVLQYLVEHPGHLVTKAELRQHVWAGTHVTDTVVRVCVREIRVALGDTVVAPQYLETVGQQGYRFLVGSGRTTPPPLTAAPLVGRQGEVATLEAWFQRTAQGHRQLVFVSGEAGIGKTTVVDLWRARLAAGPAVWLGRGQCAEHCGEGEPYLPLLEALGRLGHGPEGHEILAVLRRAAPMWLVQLPGLVSDTELERLQRQVQGATRARMIRELADALDVLAAARPLVLVLEDLHWSDHSTIECLAYLAQRREPARLLVLGTYRPVEAVLRAHPVRGLVQELCGRGQGVELRLELLPAVDVAAYMAGRLAGPVVTPLAAFVHERTEGNALFMVNLVEHLVQQGLVVRRADQWMLQEGTEASMVSLPEGIQQLLGRRIEALPPEARRVLQAASVVGEAFAVAAVAAGAQSPVEEVETVCDELATRYGFIDEVGVAGWPDGSSSGTYRFQHALYAQVLYEQLGQTRRMSLHRRIGVRLAAGYGARVQEIAVQLAVHCERGGEVARAVHYLQQAGEQAARRNAHHEAIMHLTQGLALLATLPESRECTRYELSLQLTLGDLLMAAKGMAALEARDVYTRAHVLCQQVGETPQHFRALWGLLIFHYAQGQLRTVHELSQQFFALAHRQSDPALGLAAHVAAAWDVFFRGDPVTARVHLEQSLHLHDVPPSLSPSFSGGNDPRIMHLAWLAQTLWLLGYADQARQRGQELLALARRLEHLPSLAMAEVMVTLLSQYRRDVAATLAHADTLMTLGAQQGFVLRLEQGRLLRGGALAMQGETAAGVAHLQQGLAVTQDVGPKLYLPYLFALLAEAYGQAGQSEAGLTVLDEAVTLMVATEERWWEAELYRLQGELLQQVGGVQKGQRPKAKGQGQKWEEAERCFRQALEVARGQQAKGLELRAALSLSRLWQQQGKRAQARQMLAEIYGWFTEGFDTADLQAARALLDTLG